MAGVGLRISEALAVSEDCPRGDMFKVWQQVSAANRDGSMKTYLAPLKHRAEGEYREISLPPFLADEITNHVADHGTLMVGESALLFPSKQSGKMPTASTYGYHWLKALKGAGLLTAEGKPRYTPHDLRHFFASTALAGGVPLLEVSRWLGHRSIKVTADIYGHLTEAAPERCRKVMQDALRPPLQAVQAA